MPTRVRSYSKINLGLRIGPPRADGFHALSTLYQTINLFDFVTISAQKASKTTLNLQSNHAGVPTDERNTAWKIVAKALDRMGVCADVHIHIQKELPVQGGMGAGSANAAAALIGLEKELGKELSYEDRMAVAAEVGSDVPLFLVGGTSLGEDRGQIATPYPDLPPTPCVIAAPSVGVSTPAAFREWDRRWEEKKSRSFDFGAEAPPLRMTPSRGMTPSGGMTVSGEEADSIEKTGESALTGAVEVDRIEELSRVYASVAREMGQTLTGTSGVPGQRSSGDSSKEGFSTDGDLAWNLLPALVRTGILTNDFQEVVFVQHPPLRDILHALQGDLEGDEVPEEQRAIVAMLSGSGSSLFGLYRTEADAEAAAKRVQQQGTKAMVTTTLPRSLYWSNMFAGE